MQTKNGLRTWHTEIASQEMLKIVGFLIYDGPASGLRELYANAARAVLIAVKEGITSPEDALVTIKIDADRTLTIEDNGTGITRQIYEDVLLRIGTSSNKDRSVPGMWGMGFASYLRLSSTILMDTAYIEDNELKHIACIGRDCREFQEVGRPRRTTPGTTLRMTLYDENSTLGYDTERRVRLDDLFDMIRQIGLLTRVRLEVDLTESEDRPEWCPNGIHVFEPRGIAGVAEDWMDEGYNVIQSRTDRIELAAAIGKDVASSGGPSIRGYLVGVPIGVKVRPRFSMVVNMLDEGIFEPMGNRDSLQDEGELRLGKAVATEYARWVKAANRVKNHASFRTSKFKELFLYLVEHSNTELVNIPQHRAKGMAQKVFQDASGKTYSMVELLNIEATKGVPLVFRGRRQPAVHDPAHKMVVVPAQGQSALAKSLAEWWGFERVAPKAEAPRGA